MVSNILLNKAIELALENPIQSLGRNSISRFAALLIDNKRQVVGWNSYRTHPLQARFGTNSKCVHLHCELDAIVKMIRQRAKENSSHYRDITDLSDCEMYVARVLKNGTPNIAEPCLGCKRALNHFGIEKVYWTE